MILHVLPAICAAVVGAAGCQQDRPTAVPTARPQAEVAQPHDTTLAPSADTYIRRLAPNQNQGTEPILRLTALGRNRALLRWDQQALAHAVGSGTVRAARLEVTIADVLAWDRARGEPPLEDGFTPEQEQAVLARNDSRAASG